MFNIQLLLTLPKIIKYLLLEIENNKINRFKLFFFIQTFIPLFKFFDFVYIGRLYPWQYWCQCYISIL